MTALNCTVKSSANRSYTGAGIGAGYLFQGAVNNMAAVNCNVATKRGFAHAGIGAGISNGGIVNNTMAVNCHVAIMGEFANAGIGVGFQHDKGTVTDTTALNCTVIT
ncbi:hypothetical protein [Endozoicomonas sp. ONNA2]|uniref:hypothetical protein n=1 Tax=Endozoicomonas sp. ONNA2 TaxID=2828741 RepID=UPI002147C539|nr:hypothetical protein [Endozoicomonas sp. ONNA2]